MTLTSRKPKPDESGEWPVRVDSPFMTSDAFEVLRRELNAYVKGYVAGRCFLISGHRGIGKTTLVNRAVREVAAGAVREAVAQATADGKSFVAPQRPLLVRVHGPSLATAARDAKASSAPKAGDDAGEGAKAGAEHIKKDDAASGEARAEGVLVQVAVALYRALAAEVATCFGAHARARGASDDAIEMAGRLQLELDRATDPSSLGTFWRRIGRIEPGVLWPDEVGQSLARNGVRDQGVRELAAVATMGQVFQVCTGAVKYSQIEKGASSREAISERRAAFDGKDLSGKLTALAIGAGAAAPSALAGKPVQTAVLGVAAALITAATLSVTGKTTRKKERSSDYEFIRDTSVSTLDRDLPVAISRIRRAGLAPVFVVDEIDKVPQVAALIKDVLGRLKHLTTDYGFFCFLTDRDYYDDLRARLRDGSFPVDHTYFTNWLYVVYRPDDLVRFVSDGLVSSEPMGSPAEVLDGQARAILARAIVQRSHLNTVDVVREVSRLSDVEARIRTSSQEVVGTLRFRLAVAVQLAIEVVLGAEATSERMSDDPVFAQMTLDALYRLSREWIRGVPRFSGGGLAIRGDLARRFIRNDVDGDSALRAMIDDVGEPALASIEDGVARLCTLLADFAMLAKEVENTRPELGPVHELLASGVPGGLLVAGGNAGEYEFILDHHGREPKVRQPTGGAVPEDVRTEAEGLLASLDATSAVLRAFGCSPTKFVEHGLLVRMVGWTDAVAAAGRIRVALAEGASDRLAADLPLLRTSTRAFDGALPELDRLLCLAAAMASAPDWGRLGVVVEGLHWHVDLSAPEGVARAWSALDNAAVPSHPPEDPNAPALTRRTVDDWQTRLGTVREAFASWHQDPATGDRVAAWAAAKAAVGVALLGGPADGASWTSKAGLLLAARGEQPGATIRADVRRMSLIDWSVLFLSGFEAPAPPRWTRAAALFGLRFDRKVLDHVRVEAHPPNPGLGAPALDQGQDLIDRLHQNAEDSSDGAIVYYSGSDVPAQALPGTGGVPMILISRDRLHRHPGAVEWLRGRKATDDEIEVEHAASDEGSG